MAVIRCKFYVVNKMEIAAGPGKIACWTISLSPIWETPGNDNPDRGNACLENRIFGKNTPNGSIQMTITNPISAAGFEVGREYYVDFITAYSANGVKLPE